MAETQGGYTIRSQNRFLPIIQAFTDNLYKHMQAQGELNDKLLAFNEKIGAEKFIGEYGKKIGTAKNISSLSKILSEGITTALGKGYNSVVPMMQSLAQVQQSFIGEEKINQQAKDAEAFYISQYGEQKFAWNGKETLGKDVIAQMKTQFTDPVTFYNAMTKLPEFAIKQIEGVTMANGKAIVNSAGMDAFGNVYSNDTSPIFANKTGVYRDTNKSGELDEGDKPLSPGLMKEYSDLVESDKRFNRQMATYNKPTSLGMIDNEGHLLFSDGTGGVFYNKIENGKPTGEKIYVDKVGQYSKVTTPYKKGEVLTKGQVDEAWHSTLALKNEAITRLNDLGTIDLEASENSIASYVDDSGKTIAFKNVPDARLKDEYKRLKILKEELRKKGEKLDFDEQQALDALDVWDEQRLIQENISKDFQSQNNGIKNNQSETDAPTTFNERFKMNMVK